MNYGKELSASRTPAMRGIASRSILFLKVYCVTGETEQKRKKKVVELLMLDRQGRDSGSGWHEPYARISRELGLDEGNDE